MQTFQMKVVRPKLWTEAGLKQLGHLVKSARTNKGLSLRDLEAYISQKTGCTIAYTSLGRVERGSSEPAYNTVAILAAAKFILKEDGTPYTVEELSAIASETYPKNGIDQKDDDACFTTHAILYPSLQKQDIEVVSTWNSERVRLRAQALIKASLRKMGKTGLPASAAESMGVNPATIDRVALQAFESGTLFELLNASVTPQLERAIAAICYEALEGWNDDYTPKRLGDRTYKDRPDRLLRDLANHERQSV